MNGIRTTPPRPVDIAAAFPALAPLARPAIRLHPRPGSPSVYDSSIGGPLLWPADQPWLHCDQWHDGPVEPMLPVAQLYVRDVPLLRAPGRTDLLQVLWCPSEHPPEHKPPVKLFWRTAAEVTEVLAAPPPSFEDEDEYYRPQPCVLAPEEIVEYPDYLELPAELRQLISDPDAWRAGGVAVGDFPDDFYSSELSHAPGWKVGGWAPWRLTDPVPRFCIACGAAMTPLLTIPSGEWHRYRASWIPYEDQALGAPEDGDSNPVGIQVSGGNHLQLYVCSAFPGSGHPHTDLVQ